MYEYLSVLACKLTYLNLLCNTRIYSEMPTVPHRSRFFDIAICGGGAAGTSLAQKFTRHLGAGRVCVIEPSDTHFYQPYFTLVGGGLKR